MDPGALRTRDVRALAIPFREALAHLRTTLAAVERDAPAQAREIVARARDDAARVETAWAALLAEIPDEETTTG